MALPQGQWYDLATLDEMHDDLRTSYPATLGMIEDRPQLLKHFRDCAECQGIKTAQEGETQLPDQTPLRELVRRRRDLLLDADDLAEILNLPASAAVLSLGVNETRDMLRVTVCSPDYEDTPIGSDPYRVRVEVAD